MLPTILSRSNTFFTVAIIFAVEFVLLQSSGSSSLLCLIVGSNVALAADYCQACYLKASPNERRKCYIGGVDATHAYNFYKTICKDFSPLFCFLISWMELFFQQVMMCLILAASVSYIKLFCGPTVVSYIDQYKVHLPWNEGEGTGIAQLLLFCVYFITAIPLAKIGKVIFKKDSKWTKYFFIMLNGFGFLAFFARLACFLAFINSNMSQDIAEDWMEWENTHPQGVPGLMSAASACIVAFTLWTGHTGDDNRRMSFTIPFIVVFIFSATFTVCNAWLMDVNSLSNSTLPTTLTILKEFKSQREMYLISSFDLFMLLVTSFIVYKSLARSVEIVSTKLGKSIRVDLTSVEVKPKTLRRIIWLQVILYGGILQFLCNFQQLLALFEAIGLFLISTTFIITILVSYKGCKEPKYQLIPQQEFSSVPEDSVSTTTTVRGSDSIGNESSEQSDTDIDAVVEEYKSQIQIKVFEDMSNNTGIIYSNKHTFLIIKVILNASIFVSLATSVAMIYVPRGPIISGLLIGYILIEVFLLLFAVKQPQNGNFDAKLPLMPSLPLLCLNICVVLLPFTLEHVWPVPFSLAFIGLVMYLCTTCMRQGTEEAMGIDDFHQHSICLQPLPSHSANLQLKHVVGESEPRKKKRRKMQK